MKITEFELTFSVKPESRLHQCGLDSCLEQYYRKETEGHGVGLTGEDADLTIKNQWVCFSINRHRNKLTVFSQDLNEEERRGQWQKKHGLERDYPGSLFIPLSKPVFRSVKNFIKWGNKKISERTLEQYYS